MSALQEAMIRLACTLVICVPPLILLTCCQAKSERLKVEQLQLIISGQQATIASYKDNLTSCLKENKVATQDEFTGE